MPTRLSHAAPAESTFDLIPRLQAREAGLAELSNEVLKEAARVTIASLAADPAESASPVIPAAVLALARAVETCGTFANESSAGVERVLQRRILELLRTATVRKWQTARPSAEEMLRILSGFEHVQRELDAGSDYGWAKRFAEPSGLDLLIEVAHDLRSPLTSILFLSETLLRSQSGALNDIQARQLGIIYSAAFGLISTASDVIEFAQGGDRLGVTTPEPFSVNAVMEPVRDIVQPMAEEKGILVRLLPPEPDQRVGYPIPLSRVLLNLTTNALKFTDHGFVEIVARATGRNKVEFSVRDTGRGIEPDALKTLFSTFRRRTGSGRGYHFSGTGLGLTICRKLVHAMGSELQLETRAGWGTRFFFEVEIPPHRPA